MSYHGTGVPIMLHTFCTATYVYRIRLRVCHVPLRTQIVWRPAALSPRSGLSRALKRQRDQDPGFPKPDACRLTRRGPRRSGFPCSVRFRQVAEPGVVPAGPLADTPWTGERVWGQNLEGFPRSQFLMFHCTLVQGLWDPPSRPSLPPLSVTVSLPSSLLQRTARAPAGLFTHTHTHVLRRRFG